jgi:pimeloyl-ACP methyl ester carboxylesterase
MRRLPIRLGPLLSLCFLVACAGIPTPSPESTPTDTPNLEPISTPTATQTAVPTETPRPTCTPTPSPIPNHPVGRITEHQADEDIVHNWYSYVPRGLSKETAVHILITAINGGIYDYEKSTSTTKTMLKERLGWPGIGEFVLLAPVVPRRDDPHVYPVAFDLNSFHESDDFYTSADLKVLRMIDTLAQELTSDGYNVSGRVMIEGFSSGGLFAQRFALLHPDRVQALAAGHCGGNFTLPLSEYEGVTLDWPVGTNNLEELTGITFDPDSYMAIDQLIYIGALDTGEGGTTIVWHRLHPTWGPQDHWQSVDQMEFLFTTFGETDPARLENQVSYLNSNGYSNISFKLYPNVGHVLTEEMIQDAMDFLLDHSSND